MGTAERLGLSGAQLTTNWSYTLKEMSDLNSAPFDGEPLHSPHTEWTGINNLVILGAECLKEVKTS